MTSKQPRKKRKFLYTAPLHLAKKFLNAHLSRELRSQLKKRAMRVRKGDTVKVMQGKFKNLTGKVTQVNVHRGTLNIDSAIIKKIGGKEIQVDIQASNVLLMQLVPRK